MQAEIATLHKNQTWELVDPPKGMNIVGCNSSILIQQLIHKLQSVFAMRDLGKLSYFLGIEVTYDADSMHLSQGKYVLDLLHQTSMFDSKTAPTPGIVGKSLSKFDGDVMEDFTMYKSVVGALQYLSVKRILRYLRGTIHDGLLLQPSENFTIQAYTNADWGAQPDDRRSSSGYLVYLGNNLVTWLASK
ncbi:hypothetical protein UlMin_000082 [Ulmus minor]